MVTPKHEESNDNSLSKQQLEFDWSKASLNRKCNLIDGLPCSKGIRKLLKCLAEISHDGDGITCQASIPVLARCMDCAESTVRERRNKAIGKKYLEYRRPKDARAASQFFIQWLPIFNDSTPPKSAPAPCRNRHPCPAESGTLRLPKSALSDSRNRHPHVNMNVCNVHVHGDSISGSGGVVSGDWLGNIEPQDLSNLHFVQRCWEAAQERFNLPCERRISVFAAAVYALRMKNPGGMFRKIVEGAQWHYATNEDTDHAKQYILSLDREHQDKNCSTIVTDTVVHIGEMPVVLTTLSEKQKNREEQQANLKQFSKRRGNL